MMLHSEIDDLTAIAAADRLSDLAGFAFLDSGGQHGGLGRYSFIGIDPFATFSVRDGEAFLDGHPVPGPPLKALRAAMDRYRLEDGLPAPPFRGGGIGYIAYDFGQRLERLDPPARPSGLTEEILFHFYDIVLSFDHAERRCLIFSSGFPETEAARRRDRAKARLDFALQQLQGKPREPSRPSLAMAPWRSNFTAESYAQAVERVRAYIRDGDIYQANIAQTFTTEFDAPFDHWALYHALRSANPAPFGAFLHHGGTSIASTSPERLVRRSGTGIEARPIKGTAPRSPDSQQDAALAAALTQSEKDRAENAMIVDLLRNDLSRVCTAGSVEVPVLCGLESYASVHHLTSVVTGRLRPNLDGFDLLSACFPGGSVTGAPKLRAMDIITEIEGLARGIYCGSIGYLGFDGNLDMNIAIRTVTLHGQKATFQVGGGVTLLSDPRAEYRETLDKARSIFAAFDLFQTGGRGGQAG